jgi:hypothetical protein
MMRSFSTGMAGPGLIADGLEAELDLSQLTALAVTTASAGSWCAGEDCP